MIELLAFILGETFGIPAKLAAQLGEAGKGIYEKLTAGQQLTNEELATWQKLRLKARLATMGADDDA